MIMTIEKYSSVHDFDIEQGKGPAIQTIGGLLVYLLNPSTDQISIYDIAHGLSYQCRFNGQLPQFYSVAQHCVHVAEFLEHQNCNNSTCLKGLLHDAHEAYLGDIVTPLKALLPDYAKIEHKLDAVIFEKAGIPNISDYAAKKISEADKRMLSTEIRDLRPHGKIEHAGSPTLAKPIDQEHLQITPWSSDQAARIFLQKYLQYTEQ